jgi:hypothetical protein
MQLPIHRMNDPSIFDPIKQSRNRWKPSWSIAPTRTPNDSQPLLFDKNKNKNKNSRPPLTIVMPETNSFEENSLKFSRISSSSHPGYFAEYSGRVEEGVRRNSRERSSSEFTMFPSPDIISPSKISLPDILNYSEELCAKEFEIPIQESAKEDIIYEINDTLGTIADFISIIDKYDVTKKYNIDLRLLSNIRKELVDLNGMIGMKTLKEAVFNQLIYFIQGLHLRNDPNTSIHTHGDFKHTVIYGPPGTGKTEVAKIIGRMYANLGVLQKGIFKKVTRNDLVAGYLGQTAIKTKTVINECLGGVLFIDEAYSLSNSNDLDNFSKECVDTLCEALSDHKEDLMVIIAGYEEELNEHFFKANRGLDSRFVWRFKIDSYNSNELSEIFKKKVVESGWSIETENTIDAKWFDKFKNSFRNYGRDMEMLFFYTKISHSRRIFGKTVTLQRVLSKEDVENGYSLFLQNAKQLDNTTRKLFETMYV